MNKIPCLWCFFAFFNVAYSINLSAELIDSPNRTSSEIQTDLSSWAYQLKDQFKPVTDLDLNNARQQLQAALNELDEYLPDNEDGAGWKKYILWDKLTEQTTKDLFLSLEMLQEIEDKLTANHSGLEQIPFQEVANRLRHLRNLASIKAMPNAKQQHQKLMELLAKSLAHYGKDATKEQSETIATALAWLEKTAQATRFVQAVRKQYSHPNIIVHVSSSFIGAGMMQSQEYTQPIYEQILGATVTGESHTTGSMKAELTKDSQHAAIRLKVTGRSQLETVARKGLVTVWGDGITKFSAEKSLKFNQNGFSAESASSTATSENWPRCLSAPFLFRHLAWHQVKQQRCETNYIVAQRSEPKINERLDHDADKLMDSANLTYQEYFRYPLLRAGQFPREMKFSTSTNRMNILINQSAAGQLGSPAQPPEARLSDDIVLLCHETSFNNISESLFAGRTLTDDEIREKIARYLTLKSLKQFAPELGSQSWSITFARKNPISVSLRDGIYTIVIAGDRWQSGRRRLKAMNATISYRIKQQNGSVQLVRDQSVFIAPPGYTKGQGRLSPFVISARRILQRKLDQLFPTLIQPQGVTIPGPWEQAGLLHLTGMQAESGWMHLSWKMQDKPQAD